MYVELTLFLSQECRFLCFQLVHPDRYYIRHDVITLQLSSGLKKDRCIFLFNDLVIITSCKRRSGTLTKKPTSSVIVYEFRSCLLSNKILFSFQIFRNSPSGKQYIDNAKHKLIMKISLDSIDLAAGKTKDNLNLIIIIF